MRSILLILVFLATLGLIPGCGHHDQVPSGAPTMVRAQLVQSKTVQAAQLVRAIGTVHAKDTATIAAQVTGRITGVFVREGDSVSADQPLLSIDDDGLRAAVEQAHAAFVATQNEQLAGQTEASLAASTLARYQILKEQRSVSPQEFDEVEKRSEAAQQRLASLRAQSEAAQAAEKSALTSQGYARLRAPFAGIVTRRLADPGTLASPGMPLLEVDKSGPLQLYTTVDESMIAVVQVGKTMPVEIAGADPAQMTGTIVQIVPAADPASRSFLVKLSLPTVHGLRAGMFGNALIAHGMRTSISIPKSALALRGSLACVYVLDSQGIAQLRYVTTGAAQGNSMEILSGLSEGETLVNFPGDRELAGTRVEAAP